MKKVIYISLVLIGIISIGSNFIVDSNKIDHKTVSASGTSCKWISESGYGVGPYYVIPYKATAHSLNSIDNTISYKAPSTSEFKLLPCDSTVASGYNTKDGFLIYDKNGNKYSNKRISFDEFKEHGYGETESDYKKYMNENNEYVFINTDSLFYEGIGVRIYSYQFDIINGQFVYYIVGFNPKVYDLWVTEVSSSLSSISETAILASRDFFARYSISNLSPRVDSPSLFIPGNYPTDINGDGEWTFTCVCAEY